MVRYVYDHALVQAALGILTDVVLLAVAIYSQSTQFALSMLALGCLLALALLLIRGWRSVGGGMLLGAVLLFVLYWVWLASCSGCEE